MMDQIERWANYVKENPEKWKKPHTEFIDSQFQKHNLFLTLLLNQKGGAKKIIDLYNIKNINGFKRFF
jgi:hypothetical protein